MNYPLRKTATKNPFSFCRLTGVRYFFMALCVFVISANVSGFANDTTTPQQPTEQVAIRAHALFVSQAQPAHHAAHTNNPAIVENETVDEVVKAGQSHPNSVVAVSVFPIVAEAISAKKSLFSQLRLSHEGRAYVSLVVLHHSWKIFLR